MPDLQQRQLLAPFDYYWQIFGPLGLSFIFGSFSCFSTMYLTWKTDNVFKKENIKHSIFSFFAKNVTIHAFFLNKIWKFAILAGVKKIDKRLHVIFPADQQA